VSEFLAEASVLVRPDTTKFRAELQAQLLAATKGITVPIPVVATGLATGTIVAGAQKIEQAAASSTVALQQVAATATKTTVATNGLAHAQGLAAVAAQKLALAQAGVANAATVQSAAQVTASRSVAAVAAAQRAVTAALEAGNVALIAATQETLRLAQAQELEAASALQAARAQAVHASQLGFVARGGATSILTLFGIRGATLAANAAFLAGAAGVVALAKSVGIAANLEHELNVFRVTAQATADEMERVAEEARRLGRDITLPAVSASDAAEAMTELAKAGLSVEDSLAGARGVLQLATAAEIENAQATDIVANALNVFGLAGTDAIRVADLLAGASIEAQGSIADFGGALTQASAVSRQVGISLEDTVALLTLLAKNGIQGASAGTVLRVALLRLVNPVGQAKQVIRDLGLEIRNTQGQVRPEIFAEFEQATKSLTKAQRDAAAAQVFGVRGIRAQAILGREGAAALDDIREKTQRQGQAAEIASAQTEGFSGKLENLKNSLEELGVSIGTLAIPPLGVLVDVLTLTAKTLDIAAVQAEDSANAIATDVSALANALASGSNALDKFVLGLFGTKKSGKELRDELLDGIPVIGRFFDALDAGTEPTTEVAAGLLKVRDNLHLLNVEIETAASFNVKALQGRLTGLEEQITLADIGGDVQARLTARRRRLAQIEADLAKPGVRRRPKLRRQLQEEQLALIREIAAIENEIAAEADRIAREIERQRSDADEAVVRSLEVQRRPVENLLARAAGTETLRDDIRAGAQLRDLLRQQIEIARKTIKDASERADVLQDLREQLIAVLSDLRADRRAFREQLRRELEERQERIRIGIELDIELAQITENRKAEIRARQRLLAELKKEIKEVKRGTNEWKRLRNAIAEEQAAIRELKGQTRDRNREFRELTFQFLQMQQGFAANLLGNLIPGEATGGLVGNVSAAAQTAAIPPSREVEREAQIREGRDRGVSAGQGSTQIQLLRQILRALLALNGRAGHPEARHQRATGSATMDVM
jgi:TP901 family phage tail tape measure protein